MNKKLLITIISLAIFLVCLNGISAMASYCGDGICDNYEAYNESNVLSIYNCPMDCGVLISSRWCEDIYTLIAERDCPVCSVCPTCGGCSECTVSRISNTDLNNWCVSNLYSKTTCQLVGEVQTTEGDYMWIIYWLIFLIIGIVLGYYYRKTREKKRRKCYR